MLNKMLNVKRALVVLSTASLIAIFGTVLRSETAQADDAFPADCRLNAIDPQIDALSAVITSSPALGHAGGHYARAIDDLKRIKAQLHEGCTVWNRDRNKR